MDATANKVPDLEMEMYPTLIFYSKNNKKGIEFSAVPELRALEEWFK